MISLIFFKVHTIALAPNIKRLKDNTNEFLSDLEKIIKNFEDRGDPTELNSKIKKEIIKFQKKLE